MTIRIDDTHRADLVSWVESAQAPETDFPIQNLPLGCFRTPGRAARPGVAIGDAILDLAAARRAALLSAELAELVTLCTDERSLNPLLAAGEDALLMVRREVSHLLRADAPAGRKAGAERRRLLAPRAAADLLVPARIGDYSDFYASIHHATNVGSMFRPDNALLPNYKYVPIGYHGRASSIVASGTPIRRPRGQLHADDASAPVYAPSRRLDYELEVGFFAGPGNADGRPIALSDAERHLVGACLVNDWSARDVQKWEYQPLGPFLAKNFATTVSPWVVTMEALAPFRFP